MSGGNRVFCGWAWMALAVLACAGCEVSNEKPDPSGPFLKGVQTGSIAHDGTSRTFEYYIASSVSATQLEPLLFVLHGGGGSGAQMAKDTGRQFDRLADRDGFIVVYPDGIGGLWNIGDPALAVTTDDKGFLLALIDWFDTRFGIDRKRVYFTGASLGGGMSYRMAIEASTQVAAIAPVIMQVSQVHQAVAPLAPVPVCMILGTADSRVNFASGGTTPSGLNVLSAAASVNYWVQRNGCATAPVSTSLPNADAGDGCTVNLHVYAGTYEVRLYEVVGGGHRWPGAPFNPYYDIVLGKQCNDINACDEVWAFCKRYSR